jgi:hypothetical protein
MRDLAYIALTFAFFGLAALFVVACDRIVGPDHLVDAEAADAGTGAAADELEGVAS